MIVVEYSDQERWKISDNLYWNLSRVSLIFNSYIAHGSAEKLVEDFVKTFPAFNDVGKYSDDTPIYFFKKAQLAVGELYQFLKSKDKLFEFKDITKLTIFVDNVIPAVLTKLGILKLDEELEKSKIFYIKK